MSAFEFVNGLDSKQHILQLITSDTNGKNTQFQFLNNGLLKNEYCVYLTHENPDKIKNKMREFGIDTDKYIKNGLLHIHKFPNLLDNPRGPLSGFQEFFGKIMPNPMPKFRIVGRSIDNIATKKGWDAFFEIEQFLHSNLDKMNGMILCYCEYQKLGNPKDSERMIHLLDCHTGVIFSTISEPNLAYNLENRNH